MTHTEIIKEMLKEIEKELNDLITTLKILIPKKDYFLFKGRIGKLMDEANLLGMQTAIKSELGFLELFWRQSHDDEDCVNWIEDKIQERIKDCENALKLMEEGK